jgi:hypothetical protein
MTEDLTARPGRVFVGYLDGSRRIQMFTVKSVRKRRDGTPSSAVLVCEEQGVGGTVLDAEYKVSLPKDGKLTGLRRVTVAQVGWAKHLAEQVGSKIPTDALVIVTRDRPTEAPFAKRD